MRQECGEHLIINSCHGWGLFGREVHANSSYFECVSYAGSSLQRKPSSKELQMLAVGNLRIGLCGEGEYQEGARELTVPAIDGNMEMIDR